MVPGLALHLLVFILVGASLDWVYARWIRQQGVPGGVCLMVGMAMLAGRLIWLSLPFLNPRPPLRLPLTALLRQAEFWLGWALALGMGAMLVWGIARSSWAVRQLQAFRKENPLAALEEHGQDWFLVHAARIHLEREYQRFAKSPGLCVRFSWLTLSPLITGTVRPTLYLPMPLLEERNAPLLEPIMDHEAGHIRLRHHWIYAPLAWIARLLPFMTHLVGSIGQAMSLRVVGEIRRESDDATWKRYIGAIQEDKPTKVDWSPALALSHHSQEAACRVRQITGLHAEPGYRQIGLLLWLFGLGVTASACAGRVSIVTIKEFLMKNQITGYDVRAWDPQVHIQALPGKGGKLPDGIVLDASKASGKFQTTFVGVNLRPFLLADWQAVRVSFDAEAANFGGALGELPTVSTRVLEDLYDERARQRHSWIFDFRWKPLETGKSRVTLAMRLHNSEPKLPGSAEKLVGPDIAVPAGWRLAVSHWSIERISISEVATTEFPADVDGFVTGATACHRPSLIHLRW